MKRNRRPRNPIMRTADDAITYLEEQSKPVDVESITNNMLTRIRAKVVLSHLEMLLRPFARRRAIERGYRVDDEMLSRSLWTEMGVEEYDSMIVTKQRNRDDVDRHLRAEKDVRKYLVAQSKALGRPVTAGEFEDKVVAIYERHGVSV